MIFEKRPLIDFKKCICDHRDLSFPVAYFTFNDISDPFQLSGDRPTVTLTEMD